MVTKDHKILCQLLKTSSKCTIKISVCLNSRQTINKCLDILDSNTMWEEVANNNTKEEAVFAPLINISDNINKPYIDI